MPGKVIKTVEAIFALADRRKSIYHKGWRRQVPAAIVQNLPARVLRGMVRGGMIYSYLPKKK